MGSSFNGPSNPNDQLFGDNKVGEISGPKNPPDGSVDEPDPKKLEQLLDQKTGAASGE